MTAPAFVVLTLAFHKEGRVWVGECIELGTSTYGQSFRRVHDEIIELTALHVDALKDAGEQIRFFQEHGIKVYTDDAPRQVERHVEVNSERMIEAHSISVGAS